VASSLIFPTGFQLVSGMEQLIVSGRGIFRSRDYTTGIALGINLVAQLQPILAFKIQQVVADLP
jgi:hypothetical protein